MLSFLATPIGNLEDISVRQARTITSADIILAEDTRSAQTLLHAIEHLLNLKPKEGQKIVSYYKDKEFEKLSYVIEQIEAGCSIALISEAGMPIISDPGYLLLKTVIQRGLPYEVIPGISAVTTALLHTDFKTEQFMFLGFLPKKGGQLRTILNKCIEVKKIMKDVVFVAFESPHRIHETLKIIDEVMPESDVVVTRELTKKFEEIQRGKACELIDKEYKGEITIVLS